MKYGKKILISSQNVKALINAGLDEQFEGGFKLDNYNVFGFDKDICNVPSKAQSNGILLMLSRQIGYNELENEQMFFQMSIDLKGNGRGKRIKINPIEDITTAFSEFNSVYKAELDVHESTTNDGQRWDGQKSYDLSMWQTWYDTDAQTWRKIVVGFVMCKKNPNYKNPYKQTIELDSLDTGESLENCHESDEPNETRAERAERRNRERPNARGTRKRAERLNDAIENATESTETIE